MHAGAMGIDGDLGNSLRIPVFANGLANYEAPALEAWMLASRSEIAFNASEEHG